MDFITGLPNVQGKDCIYVVVERLIIDQVCSLLCHSDRLQHSSGGQVILQGGLQAPWVAEEHR
jgi:hypothetical protein